MINFNDGDDQLPNTPEGTFSSFFDVFFDIRLGSPTGPIALSDSLTLSNSGTPWDANPAPQDIIVSGLVGDQVANWHTNKVQDANTWQMDFFPLGTIVESHPTGAQHLAIFRNRSRRVH